MLAAGGNLIQREAVMRLKWFEFYATMRLIREKNERERASTKNRGKRGKHG